MFKKKHPWYRRRGYIHFDSPVALKTAHQLVTYSARVAKHAFFPLINYELESYKLYKDDKGELQKKEKLRPIAYASHLDSHIYAYYALQLSKLYEDKLNALGLTENVLAFRSLGKSNIEFANKAFEDIKARQTCSAVALDVKGFFDNLNHQVLKSAWSELLGESLLPADHFNVFKSLTQYASVDKNKLYSTLEIPLNNPRNGRYKVCDVKTFREKIRGEGLISVNRENKGIPQGSPISALLSNIYMLEFDAMAKNVMEEQGGSYYRYCDDMLFITDREFRDDIEDFAQSEIIKLQLELNTSKTEIRDFWLSYGQQTSNLPLQYLGFTFDGQRKLIRSAAFARFSNRMKSGVRLAKKTRAKRNKQKLREGKSSTPLYKRKLYERYSHLGKRNFITYGFRAAKVMESDAIRKQLKPFWKRLQDEFE
ncbi:MAG: antiviral reverse transcriptase Drt2 [Kangiellaceae bacterium]